MTADTQFKKLFYEKKKINKHKTIYTNYCDEQITIYDTNEVKINFSVLSANEIKALYTKLCEMGAYKED